MSVVARWATLVARTALAGALIAVMLLLVGAASGQSDVVFVVNTTTDSADGSCTATACSLRDAIAAANAGGGGTIDFAIAGVTGAPTIQLSASLPVVTAPVTIDGASQPGTPSDTPGVTITNGGTGSQTLTLGAGSDGSKVSGLAIEGASTANTDGAAILVQSSNDTIAGNYVGVAADGTTTLGSSDSGIVVTGSNDTIGGDRGAGAGNVVVDTTNAILVEPAGVGAATPNANVIQGNAVGLGPDLSRSTFGENVTGIDLDGATGTIIGSNVGPGGLGNVQSSLGNHIGGSSGDAILIDGGSTGTVVAGNFVGVDSAGSDTRGNGTGIDVKDSSGNQIGPGDEITGSSNDGVYVEGTSTGDRIVANSIYGNGKGIGLADGANDDVAAPVITSVAGGTVSGTVSGPAGDSFYVELFVNPSCDGDYANGAGKTYVDYVEATPGQPWNVPGVALTAGEGVTATATDLTTSDTSEFSNCATGGSLSGSFAQPTGAQDVTAAGTADWAVWGYGSPNAGLPASWLTPNETKANGGREISDLSIVGGDGTQTRGFGSFTGSLVPFDFSWTDGTPDAAVTGGYAGITVPAVGQGLSFTVPAGTTPRTLTIWTSAHYADGTLTAQLSDGSAPEYTQTIDAVQGQYANTGENVPAAFTLEYEAASTGQHLTVTWTQDTNNGCDGCNDVVLYAAALSGGGNATSASASLTGDASVEMSGSNDLISDIPLSAFEVTPDGVTPAPINGLPINGLPINGLPINGLPINGLPINGLPINGLPINGLPINGLPINGLPLDPTRFPDGWAGVLAGTPLAGQPLQTITLQQVLDPKTYAPGSVPASVQSLTLGDLQLAGSALGQITIGALALGSTPINGLGSEGPTIEQQLQAWCESVDTGGDPTTDCSLANIGNQSLFALGLAGAPINGLPINGLPINGLPINGLPINGLPINGLDLSASPINGLPINGLPINGLPINGLPVALSDVVDCSKVDDCSTATLGEAAADGAIVPNSTYGQLIALLVAPGSAYQDTITLGDLVGLLIKRADVPWETLPPRLLSVFDPNRPKLGLTAAFTVQGSGSPAAEVQIHLPDGFDYDPGSATLTAADKPLGIGAPTIDGHTLDWNLSSVVAGVQYSLALEVRSGTTVGPAQATETVTSGSQSATSTASFTVTDSFAGNSAPGEAATITPDTAVQMSTLPKPGAVDWYRIPLPAAGTRLHVHLTDLPADYDLALYAPGTPSVRTGATDQQAPLQGGVLADQPINLDGGSNGQLPPTALQDIPSDPGMPLIQVSANRGTDDEEVGMVSPGPSAGTGYAYIAVFGYNGAFSPQPYSLRVTTQAPPPTLSCPARTFPDAGQGSTPNSVPDPSSLPQNLNTIILVNEQRLGDTYGATDEANAVGKLHDLANDASLGVSGVVVPVETIPGVAAEYSTWDANPCNNDNANAIANSIADEVDAIKAARPSVEYVVFAGGDDQIPFFRVPDLTLIDNESGFASQFGLNEYRGSTGAGDLLSDNPYLDTNPIPAGGQQLFIPNLVGGRLVETAQDIANAVTSFESSGGVLHSSTAFVSGYDFVSDGSQLAADRMSALGVNVTTLINDSWSKTDLLNDAFPGGVPFDINDWNGHYDNTRAEMANGDLLSTSDLGFPSQNDGIFFTMGCHAGFQTTDAVVGSTVLDWPQYFAEHDTGFVGNTGYGYGSTDSVAFSEELMADFAGELGGSVTLGQALTFAKDRYYLSRVAFSPYDEKTLSESELYGLPMYGVGKAPTSLMAAVDTPPDPVPGTSQSSSPSQSPLSSFPGGLQSASFSATPSFTLVHGTDGDYYTNAGQVQAPNYRPLQPYVSLPATQSGGLVAHGVVIDGLTSEDHSPFDPDNVRPVIDLSANEPEPQFTDEAWPEKIPTLVTLGSEQDVNLATGQFFTDSSGATPTGVERLWTQISGRVTYSTSSDFTPPTIDSIDAYQGNGNVAFTGHFSDAGAGVVFAQVVYDDGSGNWNALPLHYDSSSGTWSGGVPFSGQHVQFFVEACDAAGNCGYSSNKGRYFDAQPLPSPTSGSLTLTPSSSPSSTTGWYQSGLDVTATSSAQTLEASVDGGVFDTVTSGGSIALTGDGVHVVEARDSDGNTATGVYLVDSTPPATPQFTGITGGLNPVDDLPAQGAIGCTSSDATSGLASCVVTGYSAAIGTHILIATATDNAGNTSTATLTYTVGFQAGNILPPVAAQSGDQTNANATDLQIFKIKSTIPLKFQFYLDGAETTPMTTPPAGSTAVLSVFTAGTSTTSTAVETTLLAGSADSGNLFRWSTGQYVYNMATKPLLPGEYYCQITLLAADGSTVLGQSAPQYFDLRS